ncbi:hypothetical protein SDC9_129645 [bioreactor metagenome]|uniref:Uncharacterized protein n=1 Tax=bioreactor metagenome TaxID=1076179 RepID=A0A645D046_9ZZZZ
MPAAAAAPAGVKLPARIGGPAAHARSGRGRLCKGPVGPRLLKGAKVRPRPHGNGRLINAPKGDKAPSLVVIAERVAPALGVFQIGGGDGGAAEPQAHLHRAVHGGGGRHGAKSKKYDENRQNPH